MPRVVLFTVLLLMLGTVVVSAQKRITIATKEDNTAYALTKHVEGFKEKTGIEVQVVAFPFGRLNSEIKNDLLLNSPQFDGFMFAPAWITDYVLCDACPGPNVLAPLTDLVKADKPLDWFDVATFFRAFSSSYNSEIYAIPLDGDIHYFYYRKDVLEANNLEVPRTWEEYLHACEVLAALPDKDWNNDGEQGFVSCIPKKNGDLGYWFVYDVAGAYIQSQGTKAGAFFDIDTMEPLVDNPAFRKALELYKATNEFGPVNELELGLGDTRTMMLEGRCVFSLDWGDIPVLAKDTPVEDVIGTSIMPGTTEVLSADRQSLVPCTVDTCPHAVKYSRPDGDILVNHAPYAAFGGWSGAVSGQKSSEVIQMVYDFFSYVSQPSQSIPDVLAGDSGFQMYRYSQVNEQLWLDAGFSAETIVELIDATQTTLASANLMIDLRVPGAPDYQGGVLDPAVFSWLDSSSTMEEVIADIRDGWNSITDSLGRRTQLQIYRQSIGLPPKDFSEEVEVSEGARIALALVAGLLILGCLALAVFVLVKRSLRVWHYASPVFLFGSLLGAVLGYVALILYSVDASTGTCTTALWLLVIGMALLLGNVFAKTYRTWRLFSNKKMQQVRLRDLDILPIALVVVGLAAVILIVWTAMDMPRGVVSTDGVGDLEYVVICDSPDDGLAFFITTVSYFGALLLVALLLSFNTRNAGDAFNESKTLSLVVYNLTQVLIIVLVAVLAIDDPTGRYVLVTIALMFGITVTVGLLFLPKVWITIKGRGDEVAVSRFAKATAHKNRTRSGTTPGSTTSTPSNNLDPRAELNTVVTQIFDSSEV
mmetsp:Transcript_13961/g.42032  ORF Transcript_13961/g.42032 Transcript_13961/m.42032 type:complete len:818 (+) Transcript_13961:60-2513(+)